ncbi:hypothetical protein ZEAMMB73_Zm00001d005739 [Zea mays]|uniref:Uncharacterized protein n=1 Tax=Zea mays TaxID=4577 RepID=A0A1D6EPT6_MAIZE|nr:hypothetical protein ZEAMMB73_Zm00001d005739 [Zea mays]
MTAREPRGFGFIQYFDPEDASDAKYHMDGKMLLGREIAVVFAEENRKKPADIRAREKNKIIFVSTLVCTLGYLNVYYVLGIPKSLMSEVGCEPMNLDVGRADQCAGAYVV